MKKRVLIVLLESILIVLFLYFLFFIVLDKIKIPCFFNEITNLYCPGCGMTRAVRSLLNFDLVMAIRNNLLLVLLIPFFGYYIVLFLINYIKGGKLIKISEVYSKKVVYFVLVVCILFSIFRNIPSFWFLIPVSG